MCSRGWVATLLVVAACRTGGGDNGAAGEPPDTLYDFFPDDFLLVVDESHIAIPQVGGMFHGDRSRRTRLVGGAVTKLIMSLILLPFSILSKQFFMHCLYRIAKASGVLYASSTGRSYKYYSR